MHVLTTSRLFLRPMHRSDLRILQSLYGDPDLMRHITGRPRTPWETRARLKKDLGHHQSFGFGLCIAERRVDGQAIGRCGLEPTQATDGLEGELAWMFAPPWWGKGLATEAGAALLSFGLEELGLRRVFAAAKHENVASIRVMKKIGMTETDGRDGEVVFEARS